MRKTALFAIVIVMSLGSANQRTLAWDDTGHEIVAQIAFDHLNPQTRDRAIAILKSHPRLEQDLLDHATADRGLSIFLRASTWPDMLRDRHNPLSPKEAHPKWHYVDLPIDLNGVHGPIPEFHWNGKDDPANLIQAMVKVTAELKDRQTPPDRRAIDLCWIEHLVGDIHQPLHAASVYSSEFPHGDKGGNRMLIRTADGQVVNLHAFWDCIEGTTLKQVVIRQDATQIEKEHPPTQFKDELAKTDVADWAHQSAAIAWRAVYLEGKLPHAINSAPLPAPGTVPPLPNNYEKDAKAVADGQMALAGYRLAAVLETLLNDKTSNTTQPAN